MKTKFIIILFFIFSISIAQKINQHIIKVVYDEYRTFSPAIINFDIGTLMSNTDQSYYSSVPTSKIRNGEAADATKISINSEGAGKSEVILNKKLNKLIERKKEHKILKKNFAITESIPKMRWKYLPDLKKINSFVCKKATTTFRGRIYEVWYTEKIPFSAGPWKFNGLPGLILAAKDIENVFRWEVKSIELPYAIDFSKLDELMIDPLNYEKISFQEFDKKYINAINDKISNISTRNSSRDGGQFNFAYSTSNDREPFNEYRYETYFQ